ncbi:hypothetical protein GCM10009117_05650 [Gangjinia marincola]|uniref:DUF748 domain-containing protein n=1 Tax=Gangjinia marincola TaxID=578463 RepID=A0ABP3XU73_9FLAO
MIKNVSRTWKIILAVLAVLVLLYVVVKLYVHQKIDSLLTDSAISSYQIAYSDISTSLFAGNLALRDVTITGKKDRTSNHSFTADQIEINGVQILKALTGTSLSMEEVVVHGFDLNYSMLRPKSNDSNNKQSKNFDRSIAINRFSVRNGNVTIERDSLERPWIKSYINDLNIKNIKIDSTSLNATLPFTYNTLDLDIDSTSVTISPYDQLTFNALKLNADSITLNNAAFKTIVSPQEIYDRFGMERDIFDVEFPSIAVKEYDLKFNAEMPEFTATDIILNKPIINVYRNKLIKDNPKKRAMYSELLRNLPIHLNIGDVTLKDGYIAYAEKRIEANGPATLFLTNMNATIAGVNTFPAEKSQIDIDATTLLMGSGDVDAQWSFDIFDERDNFTFRADVKHLNLESISPFIRNLFNITAKGNINQLYFSIYGDQDSSTTDVKIDYTGMDIQVLGSDGDENTIKTLLGNLLVAGDTTSNSGSFDNVKATSQRDKQKSFFNYIWISLRAALKESMTIF